MGDGDRHQNGGVERASAITSCRPSSTAIRDLLASERLTGAVLSYKGTHRRGQGRRPRQRVECILAFPFLSFPFPLSFFSPASIPE